MDQQTEKRLDQIVEDEVRAAYKDLELPDAWYAILKKDREVEPGLPLFKHVRLYKLTGKRRRLVQDAVMQRYHADLKNEHILSAAQLREINIKRGEWSVPEERRLEELNELVGQESRELYLDGLDPRAAWAGPLTEACGKYRSMIAEDVDGQPRCKAEHRDEAHERFHRWLEWSKERQAEFDRDYAKAQGRESYSPDNDLQWLLDHVGGIEAYEVLDQVQELRDKLVRFVGLLEKRHELDELRVKHAKIFAESVETRRDTTEEMAKVLYCGAYKNEQGQYVPFAAKLEDMWSYPDEILNWLIVETYFFLNALPDSARAYLETMGFIAAPRPNGSAGASDASPEAESSKPAPVLVSGTA
jgi:hypothetical protein